MGETCKGDWDSGTPGQHSAERLNSSLHPKAAKQRQALLKLKSLSGSWVRSTSLCPPPILRGSGEFLKYWRYGSISRILSYHI